MAKEKSQLNVQIDPQLLIALKFEAINSGKTLSAFVTERLTQSHQDVNGEILEERLQRIEKQLDLLNNFKRDVENKINVERSIFSDSGAKKYGEVAREIFELNQKKRNCRLMKLLENYLGLLLNTNLIPN